MTIKIGLLGTSGGGKSTTGHLITGELKTLDKVVNFIPETATEAMYKGFKINKSTSVDTQLYILSTQMAAELEAGRNNPDFIICDRTMWDNTVFAAINKLPEEFIQRQFDIIRDYVALKPYDLFILFTRLSTKPVEDGIRDTSDEFRMSQDGGFLALAALPEIRSRCVVLKTMTKKERLQESMEAIRDRFL